MVFLFVEVIKFMKLKLTLEEVKDLQEGEVLKYQYLGVKDSDSLTVKSDRS